MTYRRSGSCVASRRVAALLVSIALAVSSLVVPWVASVANASTPPTTSVLIPSNGATLSGSTTLDASATNATSVDFTIFGGVYGYSGAVLCNAALTYYGWLCSVDTTIVPNGTYTLVSVASNSTGTVATSGVSITVNN
jgi:Bacterial Ig domain